MAWKPRLSQSFKDSNVQQEVPLQILEGIVVLMTTIATESYKAYTNSGVQATQQQFTLRDLIQREQELLVEKATLLMEKEKLSKEIEGMAGRSELSEPIDLVAGGNYH